MTTPASRTASARAGASGAGSAFPVAPRGGGEAPPSHRSDRLRILLVHNRYRLPGGEDVVVRTEGDLLAAHGHHVVRHEVHNDDLDERRRIELARTTMWNPASYATIRDLARRHRPHVAHVHNTFPLLSPSVYDACAAEGVPVVQTLHNYRLVCPSSDLFRDGAPCRDCVGRIAKWPGVVHACYRDSRAASAVVAAMLAYHRTRGTYRHKVDRYIALSERARDTFVEDGLPGDKIVVKGNSVPDRGIGTGGTNALFVGRLTVGKGFRLLLEAWRRLSSPVRLKVIGDGPLREEAQAAADAGLIDYVGLRSGDEVAEAMRTSGFLVFPSIGHEGMPMTILEAFAAGLPVLSTNRDVLADLVRSDVNGWLVSPDDPEALAARVEAIGAAGVPAALRRGARSTYEEGYTPEANLAALERIYRSLLGGS